MLLAGKGVWKLPLKRELQIAGDKLLISGQTCKVLSPPLHAALILANAASVGLA